VLGVEIRVLLVGVRPCRGQQEEGFPSREGECKGGYEVQLEAAWNGELDLAVPSHSFVRLTEIIQLTRFVFLGSNSPFAGVSAHPRYLFPHP
jgi:hypothetical protein